MKTKPGYLAEYQIVIPSKNSCSIGQKVKKIKAESGLKAETFFNEYIRSLEESYIQIEKFAQRMVEIYDSHDYGQYEIKENLKVVRSNL